MGWHSKPVPYPDLQIVRRMEDLDGWNHMISHC